MRKGYPSDLTDEEWKLIQPMIPKAKTKPLKISMRQTLNAMFYVNKTGCPWRFLPNDFPEWSAVYYHFDKWSRSGLWARVNGVLVAGGRAGARTFARGA